MQQVSLQAYVPHYKTLETCQIDHSRALSVASLEQSCNLIRAHDETSRTFSAQLRESRRRFCKIQQRGGSFLYHVFHCGRCFPKYFLIISAKPELKLGQHLLDGRVVNVNTVVSMGHRRNQTLVRYVCETAPKSLLIGLLKKPLSI